MSEATNEQAQMLDELGAINNLANFRMKAAQEAAQKAAMERQEGQEAMYRERDEREQAQMQARLDRETRTAALQLAINMEGGRGDAELVLASATKFAAFLAG